MTRHKMKISFLSCFFYSELVPVLYTEGFSILVRPKWAFELDWSSSSWLILFSLIDDKWSCTKDCKPWTTTNQANIFIVFKAAFRAVKALVSILWHWTGKTQSVFAFSLSVGSICLIKWPAHSGGMFGFFTIRRPLERTKVFRQTFYCSLTSIPVAGNRAQKDARKHGLSIFHIWKKL